MEEVIAQTALPAALVILVHPVMAPQHKQLALLAAMQQLELLLAAIAWQVLMPRAQETALARLAKKVLIKQTLDKHLALLA